MKNLLYMVIVNFVALLLFGCGPAHKAVKEGESLLELKDYYGASTAFAKALSFERDYQKAKELLTRMHTQRLCVNCPTSLFRS